jgi:hypothetical protein
MPHATTPDAVKLCYEEAGSGMPILFAKAGHTVNIEEPDAFNRELWNFLTLAEAGKWIPALAILEDQPRI